MLLDDLCQLLIGEPSGPEGVHQNGYRSGHADGISELQFAAVRQTCRDQVLGRISGRISCRAVHLRWILAAKSSAAVTCISTVGVDDDLSTCEAGIPLRSADDEPAGRIDQDPRLRIHQRRLDDRPDHVLDQSFTDLFQRSVGIVLR